jgi:hypothetical protein
MLRNWCTRCWFKKDHAAAGKIVVLMGAVGTVKPEAQAAKDPGEISHPRLTMSSLGDRATQRSASSSPQSPTPTT